MVVGVGDVRARECKHQSSTGHTGPAAAHTNNTNMQASASRPRHTGRARNTYNKCVSCISSSMVQPGLNRNCKTRFW